MFDKEFVCERGFGKLISPFLEVIEKRGWGFFCEHKALGFSALAREFYANMVGMKDNSIYVRGVWVPFGDRRINEIFKLRDFKHGSKYKKLLENPNYEKIVNRLIVVTKGPKGKRQKEVMVVDAETEQETNAENDIREIKEVLDNIFLEAEEKEPLRVSPTYPSFPEVQE